MDNWTVVGGGTANRVGVSVMDGSEYVLSASTYLSAWWVCFVQGDVLCKKKSWGPFHCASWGNACSIFDSCTCRGSWCNASCVSRCDRTALFSIICAHIGTAFGEAEIVFKLDERSVALDELQHCVCNRYWGTPHMRTWLNVSPRTYAKECVFINPLLVLEPHFLLCIYTGVPRVKVTTSGECSLC